MSEFEGRAWPGGDLTSVAAMKLATEAQQLVDQLQEFEKRRKVDRLVYISLLTLAVLLAGTAAGFSVWLSQLTRLSHAEQVQVIEHRDANERSHAAICKEINDIAQQAHLTPVACPSPLHFPVPGRMP